MKLHGGKKECPVGPLSFISFRFLSAFLSFLHSSDMTSRVRYELLSVSSFDLVEMLREGRLSIPPHQREFLWDLKKQQLFLATVQDGMPTANIWLRLVRGSDIASLEDGRQRLTTLMNYMKPDGTLRDLHGRLFTELPRELQRQMENYAFSVTRYSNATDEQAIDIFMRAQFGLPLTTGQLAYALKSVSPLAQYVTNTLLTSSTGLHDRAALVWGVRNAGPDKTRKTFLDAVVYGMLAVFGVATRKWGEIQEARFMLQNISALTAAATDRLTKLIRIYELVNIRRPMHGKPILNRQWNLSHFSAPILWSLYNFPAEHERLTNGWVDWLVAFREDNTLFDTVLYRDKTSARSWSDERWRFCYLRVFDPHSSLLPATAGSVTDDDDDESED